MPRSNNAVQTVDVTLQSILGRKNNYRRCIQENDENMKLFAATMMESLCPALEECCSQDNEELQTFLQTQKQRLMKVTEELVKQNRTVDTFCESLKNVKNSLDEENYNTNYETRIQTEMQKVKSDSTYLDMAQESAVREMQKTLGLLSEEVNLGDAELEVLVPKHNSRSLRCPLSGAYFEDPMKCRVCYHIYSRNALEQFLKQARGRNCKCPVPGCSNSHLTIKSCDPDPTTAMRVKKQQRMSAREKELRMSQAASVDSDEGEM